MNSIYTDGACTNQGSGAWCVIVVHTNGSTRELFGKEEETTNNRMELRAVIEGLKVCPATEVLVHTDSEYVTKGMTEWIDHWVKNGWHTLERRNGIWHRKSKKVKNVDLWIELLKATEGKKITWKWIPRNSICFQRECDLKVKELIQQGNYSL